MQRRAKFQFIGQSPKSVILSDRRESKDLGTDLTAYVIKMRRFFDSVLRTPLRMTYLVVRCNYPTNCNLTLSELGETI